MDKEDLRSLVLYVALALLVWHSMTEPAEG
jgi:hypothetical protein